MGEVWEGIKDAAKDIKDAVTGLPPMPERQPECEGWAKLPQGVMPDGTIGYWIPDKPGSSEGHLYPEPMVKIWFFKDQIKVIDKKIAVVDAKIRPYQDEIRRIEEYLASKEHEEEGEDIKEASLRKRIDALTEQLQTLRDEGLTPTDVEYRRRFQQIKALQDQLSTKTPSYESTWHITTWPVQPGGQPVPNQDLYVLLTLHKTTIERIEKFERKPLEVQRERNEAYLGHWQDIHEKRLKGEK